MYDQYQSSAAIDLLAAPAIHILRMLAAAAQPNAANLDAFSLSGRPCGLEIDGRLLNKSDLHNLVEILGSIHRAQTERDSSHSGNSERKFREFEAKLREQANMVDRLLHLEQKNHTSERATLCALQQTLFLQCPKGGKTAGYFRCVNKTGAPTLVDIRTRGFWKTEGKSLHEAQLSFQPNDRRLGPREAGMFRATVDLSRCPDLGDEPLELYADLYLHGRISLKLFINVEVYDERF